MTLLSACFQPCKKYCIQPCDKYCLQPCRRIISKVFYHNTATPSAMTPVTEIATFPLQQSLNPTDAASDSGKIWRDILHTVLVQPGCQRAYWGPGVESPKELRLVIAWSTIAHREKFNASAEYEKIVEQTRTLLAGKPSFCIADFTPYSAIGSSVTEVLNLYFPSTYSDAEQEVFLADMNFLSTCMEKAKGYTGLSKGWAMDEGLTVPETGEQAKVYVILLGWESVACHDDFRQSDLFAENIHLLQGAKGLMGMDMCHVKLTEEEK